MSWGRYRYWHFPKSRPRRTKGGIRAQSKRGGFGESWWAKRWIAVLESFNIGARLGRGRSYARRGQVTSIEIEKGKVRAKVQGSRPRPYDVTIKAKALSAAGWKKIAKALSKRAAFAAKLLAGEMPDDIEKAFKKARLSLFPERSRDLRTDCSCPDWSNPCKHIAAVYYLLGEEFDRDPFLIFKLRGITKEGFVKLLGGSAPRKKRKTSAAPPKPEPAGARREPLARDPAAFWAGGELADDLFGEVSMPRVPAALVKRLGSFPFWRGEEPFLEVMERVYTPASPRGLDVFLGERT